jgi:hypothetical protein
MFARAVTARVLILPALLLLAGCGAKDQAADEPSGTFRVDVVRASFPAKQSIAESTTMRIKVRNASQKTVPEIGVTVVTEGQEASGGLTSFGQTSADARLADPNRPIWVLDREPGGGTSVYSNTWTLGSLPAGRTKTFEWKVTPVVAGDYTLRYRIAAGLDGKAKIAEDSKATGTFRVRISDKPVPARVDDNGNVVRGN